MTHRDAVNSNLKQRLVINNWQRPMFKEEIGCMMEDESTSCILTITFLGLELSIHSFFHLKFMSFATSSVCKINTSRDFYKKNSCEFYKLSFFSPNTLISFLAKFPKLGNHKYLLRSNPREAE